MFYARAPSRGMGGWQGGHRTRYNMYFIQRRRTIQRKIERCSAGMKLCQLKWPNRKRPRTGQCDGHTGRVPGRKDGQTDEEDEPDRAGPIGARRRQPGERPLRYLYDTDSTL